MIRIEHHILNVSNPRIMLRGTVAVYGSAEIEDTYAEVFPMIAGRILITADSEKWALTAARTATGFASSIIMSPAEAGIE